MTVIVKGFKGISYSKLFGGDKVQFHEKVCHLFGHRF